MTKAEKQTPKVFISSTNEDLATYRKAAKEVVLRAQCQPIMQEYWAAGGNPPLHECLEKWTNAMFWLFLLLIVMAGSQQNRTQMKTKV